MSAVEVFQFPATGAAVRTVVVDGTPLFVARDAAEILGYSNPQKAVRDHVPIAHRGVNDSFTPDLDPQTVLITEAGLYRLIMRSRTAAADAFQEWVTADVLPTIRKTGRYEVAPALPQSYADALRELAAQVEETERVKAELEAAAPRAQAWDTLASGDGDYSVRDAAKILSRDPVIALGERLLFDRLKVMDWTYRGGDGRWRAKQAQINAGRLAELPQSKTDEVTGETTIYPPQVRVTVKGLYELHRRLGGLQPLRVDQPLLAVVRHTDSPAGPRDTPVSPGLPAHRLTARPPAQPRRGTSDPHPPLTKGRGR